MPPLPLPTPVEVLHAWDEHRADAWASGDVAGLRSLYTPGSATGYADIAMLRAWRARGLRVEGLTMQLLSVRVLARSDGWLRLRVVDRVAGGTAVGPGVRVELPRDQATTHLVVLRVIAGEWRVS